MVTFIVCAF